MLCFSGKEYSEFPKKVLVLIGILTNGWKWWKYKTAEGTESYIDDYRL